MVLIHKNSIIKTYLSHLSTRNCSISIVRMPVSDVFYAVAGIDTSAIHCASLCHCWYCIVLVSCFVDMYDMLVPISVDKDKCIYKLSIKIFEAFIRNKLAFRTNLSNRSLKSLTFFHKSAAPLSF